MRAKCFAMLKRIESGALIHGAMENSSICCFRPKEVTCSTFSRKQKDTFIGSTIQKEFMAMLGNLGGQSKGNKK